MRAIRRGWGELRLDWRAGLRRLPFFTQKTAVLLVGVLVATLALLGGVVALIGSPWSAGPTQLVPGGQAGERPSPRPATGDRGTGPAGAATRTGSPSGAPGQAASAGPAAEALVGGGREATGSREPGGTATEPQGSGGAAGAGAGGPPAAPPTTSPPTTTTPNGPLPPLDDLLGPVVSTLLP
ncbi:MAG TPA: hypothetical protein VGS14_09960 [Actinomycetes bacterium]|nr:hypothetical protein [Actinomycetes bacterium]